MARKRAQATTIYTYAAFHYDVAYRQTFEGYLDRAFECIHRGLELLGRHEDYVFVIEQVVLVREYWRRFPEQRASMRQFADAGRLVFAPGLFTMPDGNIPCGEAVVRNAVTGQQWLEEHLGVRAETCWNADIFGHHSQSPQLYTLCGLKYYLFERGRPGEYDTDFWWEGIDGTRMLTHWQLDTYFGTNIALAWQDNRDEPWVRARLMERVIEPLKEHSADATLLCSPIGGDFLVPRDSDVGFFTRWNKDHPKLQFEWARPERYFQELDRRHGNALPVVQDELNPMLQGTYSSRIRIKQHNRRLEQKAATLELLDVALADQAPDDRAPQDVWETVLWNQFHDILCGTVDEAAYRECLQDYEQAERLADRAIDARLTRFGRRVKFTGRGRALLLFNPLPYPRTEVVEVPIEVGQARVADLEVLDERGKPVPTQLVDPVYDPSGKTLRRATLLVEAVMPASTVRLLDLRYVKTAPERPKPRALKVDTHLLENARLRVRLNELGWVVSFYDKRTKQEYVDPARPRFHDLIHQADFGDLWTLYEGPINASVLRTTPQHDPMPLASLHTQIEGLTSKRAANAECFTHPEIRVVERGPLRVAVEVAYGESQVVRMSLGAHDTRLCFRTRLVPSGDNYRLRAAFATNIDKGRIRHAIPCGWIKRDEGEYPAQQWIDYADRRKGLCLLNRGLPGNNVTDGVMMLSLFRAKGMTPTDRTGSEQGVPHVFEYAVAPFKTGDRDYHPARLGLLFNRPVLWAFPEPDAEAEDVLASPVVHVDRDNVELMCLRPIPDGAEVRVYEAEGKQTRCRLTFSRHMDRCAATNALGDDPHRLPVTGNAVTLSLRPFQVVNLRITFA